MRRAMKSGRRRRKRKYTEDKYEQKASRRETHEKKERRKKRGIDMKKEELSHWHFLLPTSFFFKLAKKQRN